MRAFFPARRPSTALGTSGEKGTAFRNLLGADGESCTLLQHSFVPSDVEGRFPPSLPA